MILLDASLIQSLSTYFKIGLIVLFLLVVIGLLIAARVGYKKGFFKSTYMLLGYAFFFALALLTMNPIIDAIQNVDVSGFIEYNLKFDFAVNEIKVNVDVPLSSVNETLTELSEQIFSAFRYTDSSVATVNSIKVIVFSLFRFVFYIVDVILIMVLGTLFLQICWFIFFRKTAPKIARRLIKVRWVGMIENSVKYLGILFMLFSPFTSLLNSINNSYQKNKKDSYDNSIVTEVGNLIDIYNDSIFAKTFFNWGVNLNDGKITLDSLFMNYITKAEIDEASFSFTEEITNLANFVFDVAGYVGDMGENGMPSVQIGDALITTVFDFLGNSNLLANFLPLAVEIVANKEVLEELLPGAEGLVSEINLDNVTYQGTLDTLENLVKDLVDSELAKDFFDLDTLELKKIDDMAGYLDDLFSTDAGKAKVNEVLEVFDHLEDFTFLNNLISGLGIYAVSKDTSGNVLKYLGGDPSLGYTVDEGSTEQNPNITLLKDFFSGFNLGRELYNLSDSMIGLASCGEHVIKNSMTAFTGENEEEKTAAKKALAVELCKQQTLDNFLNAICGPEVDPAPASNAQNPETHKSLMDLYIVQKVVPNFFDNLFDNVEGVKKLFKEEKLPEIKANYESIISDYEFEDYRLEFRSILSVVTDLFEDNSADIAENPESTFAYNVLTLFKDSFKDDAIGAILGKDSDFYRYSNSLKNALGNLDDSKIMYGLIVPFLKDKIDSVSDKFKDFLSIDIIDAQFDHYYGVGEGKHATLFSDLGALIGSIYDDHNIQVIYECMLKDALGKNKTDDQEPAPEVRRAQLFEEEPAEPGSGEEDKDSGLDINKMIGGINSSCDFGELDEYGQPITYNAADAFENILISINRCNIFNPQETYTYVDSNSETVEIKASANSEFLFKGLFNKISDLGLGLEVDESLFGDITSKNDAWTAWHNDKLPSSKTYNNGWEEEIGGIVSVLKSIAKSNMLNISNYSGDDLTSILGDLGSDDYLEDSDKPCYLKGLLSEVGNSYLFCNSMGGLLQQNIGSLLSDDEDITFANIHTPSGWRSEAEALQGVLKSASKIEGGLNDLDISKVNDVVVLNDMLHSLADSGIFHSKDNSNLFGQWLFSKLSGTMADMSDSGDLLADADEAYWNDDNNVITESMIADADIASGNSNHRVAYYDFVVRDGHLPSDYANNKEGWSSSTYKAKAAAFETTKASKMDSYKNEISSKDPEDTEFKKLYLSDTFYNDYYNEVLQYDEVGRLIGVIINVLRFGGELNVSDLSVEELDNLLTALNRTNCLRMATYNALNMAKSISNEYFDLNNANIGYMVSANTTIEDYDNQRSERQNEIDKLLSIYDVYKTRLSGGISLDTLDYDALSSLNDAVLGLYDSNIFHKTGNPNDDGSGEYFPTTFEGLMSAIINNTPLKDYLYNVNSPKDIALADIYETFDSEDKSSGKTSYLIKNMFRDKTYSAKENPVTGLFEVVCALKGEKSLLYPLYVENNVVSTDKPDYIVEKYDGLYASSGVSDDPSTLDVDESITPTTDLGNVDINISKNTESLVSILKVIDNNDLLFDVVPNALNNMLGSKDIDGVSFSSYDSYCVYNETYNDDENYDTRYSDLIINEDNDTELDAIGDLLKCYQDYNYYVGSGSMTSVSTMNNLFEHEVFENLLGTMESSIAMNKSKDTTSESTDLSLFQSMVNMLMNKSGLQSFANADDNEMKDRIKNLSNYAASNSDNPNGYNNSWAGEQGEINDLVTVLKSIVNVTSGDNVDANALSLTALSPDSIKNVMKSVNGSYLCNGILEEFISNAFDGGLGLSPLLTYDNNTYVKYDLDYMTFGGENNACEEGSEIYNLHTVLDCMYREAREDDPNTIGVDETRSAGFADLTDLSAFAEGGSFEGLFYFLYNSKILNDSSDNTKTVDNYKISGKSVLIFNALESFKGYLIGDSDLKKIASVEKIFSISAENSVNSREAYKIEASGLQELITTAGNSFSNVSFDSLNSDETTKNKLLNFFELTYTQGDNNDQRAFLVSEVIAGIFDDILDSEDIAPSNADKFYFASNTSEKLTDPNEINKDSFSNINAVEKNGLDGMISLPSLLKAGNTQSEFLSTIKSNLSSIEDIFVNKLCTDGESSNFAKVLYVAKGLPTIEEQARNNNGFLVLGKFAQEYGISDPQPGELESCWWLDADGYTEDFFVNSFDFATYGQDLCSYINECVPQIG